MIETMNKQEMERLTRITKHSNSVVSVDTYIPSKTKEIGGLSNYAPSNIAMDYPINNDPLKNKDPS
jgi:hypothetical protein